MLLNIDEIKAKLDAEFLPLEPMLSGYRMIDSTIVSDELEGLEKSLNTRFPGEFRNLVFRYDFCNLTIGPIFFGTTGDYIKTLKEYNLSEQTKEWTLGPRPNHIVLIADSDPYAICLNCENGHVLAFLHEESLKESVTISSSFELFFRGIGTVILMRTEVEDRYELATQVAAELESQDDDFWMQLAE